MFGRFSVLMLLLATLFGCAWAEPFFVVPPAVQAVRNYSPRYSPDGKWIAFLRGSESRKDTELWVMDADGKNARALLTRMSIAAPTYKPGIEGYRPEVTPEMLAQRLPIQKFLWMPDSKSLLCSAHLYIALVSTTQFNLVTLDGTVKTLPYLLNMSTPCAIAPDGKSIMVCDPGHGFSRFPISLETITIPKIPPILFRSGPIGDADWGVDNRIYFTSVLNTAKGEQQTGIFAIEPNGTITPLATPWKYLSHPALSPDGKWLAYGRGNELVVREMATAKETVLLKTMRCYRWLPDGRLLAYIYRATPPNWGRPNTYQLAFYVTRPDQHDNDLLFAYTYMSEYEDKPTRQEQILPEGAKWIEIDLSPYKAIDVPGFVHDLLPDISQDGKRIVYEWGGALYVKDLPDLAVAREGNGQ